jgi:hypothetical protein
MLAGWFANLLESKEIDQSHLVDHDVFAAKFGDRVSLCSEHCI